MRKDLPEKGWSLEQIEAHLNDLRAHDLDWKSGRSWSLMYRVDEAHQQKVEAAYQAFFSENFVSPLTFGSLRRMEREIVEWSADLLHAPKGYTGMLTGGGSESIFLVVLACRERARKKGVLRPEILLPVTAHPAFTKAAEWLDMPVRFCPVDEEQCPDLDRLARLINRKTALVVASAPAYPHGILDPIAEMGELVQARQIPFHIDACVGGFMLPWVEKLGHPIREWDFRIEGVTSMSADLHKFGYAAKNCSVLLYREPGLLNRHVYVRPDWPGGIYATAGLLGTRPGGAIAAAWASLRGLGQEGFLATARKNLEAANTLKTKLEAIPELEIIGRPCMNILAYRTQRNHPDLFILADFLAERGWLVDRQHKPPSIHLTVMTHNHAVLDAYVADVREGLAFAKNNPDRSGQGEAVMYGLLARLPSGRLVKGQVKEAVLKWYQSGEESMAEEATHTESSPNKVPAWQSWINHWLLRWQRWRQK